MKGKKKTKGNEDDSLSISTTGFIGNESIDAAHSIIVTLLEYISTHSIVLCGRHKNKKHSLPMKRERLAKKFDGYR